jgi:hypothetical protein
VIDESAEVDIARYCREFSDAREIARGGCCINYGIAIRNDTDEAIRKAARICP